MFAWILILRNITEASCFLFATVDVTALTSGTLSGTFSHWRTGQVLMSRVFGSFSTGIFLTWIALVQTPTDEVRCLCVSHSLPGTRTRTRTTTTTTTTFSVAACWMEAMFVCAHHMGPQHATGDTVWYSNILLLPTELIRFVPRLTLHDSIHITPQFRSWKSCWSTAMLRSAVLPLPWMSAPHVHTRSLFCPCRPEEGGLRHGHGLAEAVCWNERRVPYLLVNVAFIEKAFSMRTRTKECNLLFQVRMPLSTWHSPHFWWFTQVRKDMDSADATIRQSRFYFADLGGSEQLSKSKVDAATKAPVLVPRWKHSISVHHLLWV